jgi:hypothetical protein
VQFKRIEVLNLRFIENSNLPINKVKLVIIDDRMGVEGKKFLRVNKIEYIEVKKNEGLYDAISGHPDIILNYLGKGKFVVSPNIDKFITNKLMEYGAKIIFGNSIPKYKYPYNIMYNVLIVGNYAIHNFKYTDKNLIRELEKCNYKFINVRQGYTKCMVCVVDKNSLITSDKGIYNACKAYNLDVLLINNEENIDLFELKNGFLGGATGKIASDILILNGNQKYLKSIDKIKKFVKSKGVKFLSVNYEKIVDIGSIIPIIEE